MNSINEFEDKEVVIFLIKQVFWEKIFIFFCRKNFKGNNIKFYHFDIPTKTLISSIQSNNLIINKSDKYLLLSLIKSNHFLITKNQSFTNNT